MSLKQSEIKKRMYWIFNVIKKAIENDPLLEKDITITNEVSSNITIENWKRIIFDIKNNENLYGINLFYYPYKRTVNYIIEGRYCPKLKRRILEASKIVDMELYDELDSKGFTFNQYYCILSLSIGKYLTLESFGKFLDYPLNLFDPNNLINIKMMQRLLRSYFNYSISPIYESYSTRHEYIMRMYKENKDLHSLDAFQSKNPDVDINLCIMFSPEFIYEYLIALKKNTNIDGILNSVNFNTIKAHIYELMKVI